MIRKLLLGAIALYLISAPYYTDFHYSTYWGRRSFLTTDSPYFEPLAWFVNRTAPGDLARRVMEFFTEPQGPN